MATETKIQSWEDKRTQETRSIENELRKQFPKSDAYRFNSASIRVRIIDNAFHGKTESERERMIDPILEQLPEETQADIMLVLTLTEEEATSFNRHYLTNLEFENPSVSGL
jgi:stress-induced morphogen